MKNTNPQPMSRETTNYIISSKKNIYFDLIKSSIVVTLKEKSSPPWKDNIDIEYVNYPYSNIPDTPEDIWQRNKKYW